RVLHEERRQALDLVAAANRIRQIEALMKINHPLAVRSHSLPRLRALFLQVRDPLPRVVGGVRGRIVGAEAEGAIAGLHGQPGTLLDSHTFSDTQNDSGRIVEFAIIAGGATQELMNGASQHLALDVPESQVEG